MTKLTAGEDVHTRVLFVLYNDELRNVLKELMPNRGLYCPLLALICTGYSCRHG
jgi:hypothetical protein